MESPEESVWRRIFVMRAATDRAGFSVMEVLIVLAIMSLGAAIVLPRGSAMMDRMMTHVVFFEIQQQVSERRREAFRTEQAMSIPQTNRPLDEAVPGLRLRPGWSYRLDRPLDISAGGRCGTVEAEVFREGRPAMRLRSDDGACHFIRRD